MGKENIIQLFCTHESLLFVFSEPLKFLAALDVAAWARASGPRLMMAVLVLSSPPPAA